jgi:hypothetical protein
VNAARLYGVLGPEEAGSPPNVDVEGSSEARPLQMDVSGGLSTMQVQELSRSREVVSYFGGEKDRRPSEDDKRASAFLQDRCPLCFGGELGDSLFKG